MTGLSIAAGFTGWLRDRRQKANAWNAAAQASPEPSDEDLMAGVARGDHEAFAALVARYERWARTVAGRILKNFDEADDLVQDAFLKVWVNGPQWKPRGTFKNYLLLMLTRQCLDFLRRKRPLAMEHPPEAVDRLPSPREQAIRMEEAAHLAAQIDRLPDRQRMAILLVYGEDLSQKDAAEAMSISPKAFESLLIRARAGLKRFLEEDQQ